MRILQYRFLTRIVGLGLLLTLFTLSTSLPTSAYGGGDLTLVSAATDGGPGNYASFTPSISADGRYVAFASGATNLVASDANGATRDIFIRDLQTGTTVLVSVASDGTQGDGGSYNPSISADGRYVAFESVATNLISLGTGENYEIYVHDRDADGDGILDEPGGIETTRVSVNSDGNPGNGHAFSPSISGNGRYVAFASSAFNLVTGDANGARDIFVHDRQTGITTCVSVHTDGTLGNHDSYSPDISADGYHVAFYSEANNLVSGDTNGVNDVFVHDRWAGGTTTRVSVDSGGGQADGYATAPTISPDGRYVSFSSAATDLVSDDTNAVPDVFLHDRDPDADAIFDEAGEIETNRISLPNCGGEADGDLIESQPALSSDGRYVAFHTTATNLINGDSGLGADTFVRDRTLGQTAFVSIVPSVEGVEGGCYVDMSDNGRYVTFQTGSCINGGQIYVRDRGDLLPSDAPTDLLHVSTEGSNTAGCGETDSPCRTVQYAVDRAACGATIKVATGTYTGIQPWIGATETTTQVVYLSQPITITGGFTTSGWATSDPILYPTILDAEGQGQVIVVGSAPTVTLEGLRVVNGYSTYDGGGVGTRDAPCHLTIRASDILSNTTEDDGAGVYLNFGTLILEGSHIVSNTATSDGGGVYARRATVTMTQNLFRDNVAYTGDGRGSGGGAWLYEAPAAITDNTFQDNLAGGVGGGLYVGWGGDLTLIENEFLHNTANDYAGGLHAGLNVGNVHTITHNLFQGNVANPSGSGSGGGAYLTSKDGAQLTFRHNQIVGNYACTGPTGANGGLGGGVFVMGPAMIADNLIQGNWATSAAPEGGFYFSGYGGGLYVKGPGVWVQRNLILDNVAARNAGINYTSEAFGGGIHVGTTLNTVVTMTNNILAGNRHCADCGYLYGFYRGGGAIAVGGYTRPADTRLILTHNTIADNQSPAIFNESAAITMSHSILSGHDIDLRAIPDSSGAEDSLPPTNTADHTLWWPAMTTDIVSGTWTHTNDLTGDPDFISTALDDYHLGINSRAIDRGPGADMSEDIDGHPRPLLSGYDLGADEYTGIDLSQSAKTATPSRAAAGDVITFTITIYNDGQEDAPSTTLTDAIPPHTTYVPNSVQASSGTITATDEIRWNGTITAGTTVTVTLQVTLTNAVVIQNTALITDTYGTPHTVTARVNTKRIYLPLIMRSP